MDAHGELCKCPYVTSLDLFSSILQTNLVCLCLFQENPMDCPVQKGQVCPELATRCSSCFQGTVAKRAVRNLGDMVGEEVAMTVQVWRLRLGRVGIWVGRY